MRVREILSAKSIGEVFTIRPDATVAELLTTLAGRTIDIGEERANVWHLLGGKDA